MFVRKSEGGGNIAGFGCNFRARWRATVNEVPLEFRFSRGSPSEDMMRRTVGRAGNLLRMILGHKNNVESTETDSDYQ